MTIVVLHVIENNEKYNNQVYFIINEQWNKCKHLPDLESLKREIL